MSLQFISLGTGFQLLLQRVQETKLKFYNAPFITYTDGNHHSIGREITKICHQNQIWKQSFSPLIWRKWHHCFYLFCLTKSVLDHKIIYAELHYKCIRFGIGAQRESPQVLLFLSLQIGEWDLFFTTHFYTVSHTAGTKKLQFQKSWVRAGIPEQDAKAQRATVAPSEVQVLCGL